MSKKTKRQEAKHAALLARQRRYDRNKFLNVRYSDDDKKSDYRNGDIKFFTQEEIAAYTA